MKTHEKKYELFDTLVRRLANGSKHRIILEVPYHSEHEHEMIDFRESNVKLTMFGPKDELIINAQIYEVFDLKTRKLKDGNKYRIILEKSYDKKLELAVTPYRFAEINVVMEQIPEDMFQQIESQHEQEQIEDDAEYEQSQDNQDMAVGPLLGERETPDFNNDLSFDTTEMEVTN